MAQLQLMSMITSTDPLYKAALRFKGSRADAKRVATAAYDSERMANVVRYLERKQGLDRDDGRQILVMALLQTLERGTAVFETEASLYSYLIRVGVLSKLKDAEINHQTFSYDEPAGDEPTGTSGHSNLFSDGNHQSDLLQNAHDQAVVRREVRPYRFASHSINRMLQSSHSNQVPTPSKRTGSTLKSITVQKKTGKPNPSGNAKSPHLSSLLGGAVTVRNVEPIKTKPKLGRPAGTASPMSPTSGRRSPIQQELFDLWTRSNLLQTDYAEKIKITAASLKAYLYARTKEVPIDVIRAARLHDKDTAGQVKVLNAKFEGSMSEIIARWEQQIAGGEKFTSAKLASILEVDSTTVLRWRGDSKPNTRALARYELKLRNHYKK